LIEKPKNGGMGEEEGKGENTWDNCEGTVAFLTNKKPFRKSIAGRLFQRE
jgi:hypothetical protein